MLKFTSDALTKVFSSKGLKAKSLPKGLSAGYVNFRFYNSEGTVPPEDQSAPIPPYEDKVGEPIHLKKARLLYQSRKRGMLENGLILSSFADRYLQDMSEEELSLYDRLINLPSNDWEIYYWAAGVKPTPQEFESVVMQKLRQFVKNEERENRTRQPDLK